MTYCAIRGATALRTPPTKCAGRALFDEDATPCGTERSVSYPEAIHMNVLFECKSSGE
jgi:hypothetical protein